MQKIRIKENTSIDDINAWLELSEDIIVFEVLLRSSFQLFAEGVALATLKELKANKKAIYLEFFKEPKSEPSFDDIHPILLSVFGLELLRLTEKTISNSAAQNKLHSKVGKLIWKRVLKEGGLLGGGRKSYLISRHDYDIPQRIRNLESPTDFPRFDYFKPYISKVLLGLRGYTRTIGENEMNLIEWLHHIAENAHEHGSFSFIDNQHIEGFRGIELGKLIFKTVEEIDRRKDFPDLVNAYIHRLLDDGVAPKRGLIFNYATVIDCGDGIQNTIPNSKPIDKIVILSNAFRDGVTRKNSSMDERSGYGLGQSVVAGSNLKALLHLVSGNIEAVASLGKKADESGFMLKKISTPAKTMGTSLSIFWLNENQINEGVE